MAFGYASHYNKRAKQKIQVMFYNFIAVWQSFLEVSFGSRALTIAAEHCYANILKGLRLCIPIKLILLNKKEKN